MTRINSQLKTWLKCNGFKSEGYAGKRQPMRETNGYLQRYLSRIF